MANAATSHNLALHQLAANQVLDPAIQQAIIETDRSKYVPEKLRKAAYADSHIAIKPYRYVISPSLAGRIITNLRINRKDTVLELGSGTGYLSAILARLKLNVISLETDTDLYSYQKKLSRMSALTSPTLESKYPSKGSKFSTIIVNGASDKIPTSVMPYLSVNSQVLWFRTVAPASNNSQKLLCEMTLSIFDGAQLSHRRLENIVLYPLGGC